jgi:predicted Zn-dependent protease
VLVLRWFRERGCVHCLARDAGISQATGYRYLHEGIDVLAAQAPDLHAVLDHCRRAGMTHVILDGTVRHEALEDRAGVKGLRHRAVAAVRLKLRAA